MLEFQERNAEVAYFSDTTRLTSPASWFFKNNQLNYQKWTLDSKKNKLYHLHKCTNILYYLYAFFDLRAASIYLCSSLPIFRHEQGFLTFCKYCSSKLITDQWYSLAIWLTASNNGTALSMKKMVLKYLCFEKFSNNVFY